MQIYVSITCSVISIQGQIQAWNLTYLPRAIYTLTIYKFHSLKKAKLNMIKLDKNWKFEWMNE